MAYPNSPQIVNTVLDGTEQTIVLPQYTEKIMVKSRQNLSLKFSWAVGGTSSSYIVIPANADYYEDDVTSPIAIYVLGTIGDVCEVIAWSGA